MPTNRRKAIKMLTATSLGSGLLANLPMQAEAVHNKLAKMQLKGNINHAVCRWTYSHLELEALCTVSKEIGIKAIDLVGPKEWHILKKHGLESSMCNGAEISLTVGFNDPSAHSKLVQNYTEHIDLVSKAGYKNLICFSGNRNGMDDETGLKNAAEGLKKIVGLAEKKGVVLIMELLNSKIDHKDYMCDRTHWGVELCKRVGSPNFKLLYDIYHMQIDEGDVINTIRQSAEYIGHYHTAGVPGRNEIEDNQELYYPAIMRAIVQTGFKGYVAQEFIPKKEDKTASLRRAVEICDV
jgi:hydroxypyruvate isomerase